jgi:hypothetical protein
MVQQIAAQVADIIDLEGEIEAQFRNSPPIREQRPVNFAPPAVRAPTPSIPYYVEHCEGPQRLASCRRKPLSANMKLRRKRSRGWAQS